MSLWQEFGTALGRERILVALVVEASPALGTSVVEFPNGGRLIVRGATVEVGKHAFVQAGEVRSVAPSITPTEVEV